MIVDLYQKVIFPYRLIEFCSQLSSRSLFLVSALYADTRLVVTGYHLGTTIEQHFSRLRTGNGGNHWCCSYCCYDCDNVVNKGETSMKNLQISI